MKWAWLAIIALFIITLAQGYLMLVMFQYSEDRDDGLAGRTNSLEVSSGALYARVDSLEAVLE